MKAPARVVVSALQVAPDYSGIGRRALSLGEALHELPENVAIEVRCPSDVLDVLRAAYPKRTQFHTPIAHSRPRERRIAYEQLLAPALNRSPGLLICIGDQAPLWGVESLLLVVNDVRRMVLPERSLDGAYYRRMVPRAVRRASTVVTVSEFSRREIRRELGVDATVLADHPKPQVTEPLRGGSEGWLAVVGALRRYKAIETAIDALLLLPPEARRPLVFAGSDEGRRDEIVEYAQARGAGNLVRLLGWVDESGLRSVYEGSVASISTSTYEGYGFPVPESLGYGLPTIASDLPPHRETAGDAALYFAPKDATTLAQHIRRILEDDSLRRSLAVGALARSHELADLGPRWSELILQALRG
jgi:glycosyltransferase involved in cell wall biosynthesis